MTLAMYPETLREFNEYGGEHEVEERTLVYLYGINPVISRVAEAALTRYSSLIKVFET